jgi:hypothetical protein
MAREPQLWDRYETVDGPGTVVARSQTPSNWIVRIKVDSGEFWQGSETELGELLEAAGEKAVLAET